jgi:hypothetical protein
MTTTTTTGTNQNGKIAGKVTGKETVRIMDVTPAQAQKWLEGNVDNRDLRETRVLQYAQILQRGEWELTGDAIVFDENGTLLNGQHRLSAVVVAGIPARFIVLRGVPAKAQEVMDTGLARSLGDQLKRRGVPYYTYVAGALVWLHRMEYAEMTGVAHYGEPSQRPTFRQLLALYERNSNLPDQASRITKHVNSLKVRAGSTLAIYHRLLQIDDPNIAQEVSIFFQSWLDGTDLRADNPIWRLREWCLEDAATRHTRGRAPDYRYVAYVLTAWNKWRQGESVRQLKWTYTPTNRMAWPVPE